MICFPMFPVYSAAHSVTVGNPCTGESKDACTKWNGGTSLHMLSCNEFDCLCEPTYLMIHARSLLMATISPW